MNIVAVEEEMLEGPEESDEDALSRRYAEAITNYLNIFIMKSLEIQQELKVGAYSEALEDVDFVWVELVPPLRKSLGDEMPSEVVKKRIKDLRGYSYLKLGFIRDFSVATDVTEYDRGDAWMARAQTITRTFCLDFLKRLNNLLYENNLLPPGDERLSISDIKDIGNQLKKKFASAPATTQKVSLPPVP